MSVQKSQIKNKIRLTALDIGALVEELKHKLIGTRLSNIYNVNSKEYVFKFSMAENKYYLIIENGLRFNLTESDVARSKVPSGFTMKFRKFLRSRRLESIEQIGVERVVVCTFGRDDHTYYLILELYAQGNIILADKDYRVIQLTRQHQFSEEAKVAPDAIYPFEHTATNYLEKLDTSLAQIEKVCTQSQKSNKFKEVLFKVVPCLHASLTDDLIMQCGFNPNEKITTQFEQVKKVVDFAMEYILKFRQQKQYKGYLIAKEPPKEGEEKAKFIEVVPELAPYHKGYHIQEVDNFNEAVNIYFKQADRTVEDNKPTIEDIAWKKYENIKQDQDNRIKKLQDEQDEYLVKAQLIQDNMNDVQAIIDILAKMVSNSIAWDKICKMINESKKDGNPLSNMIGNMKFEQHKISIYLGQKDDEYSELVEVEIDIRLSGYQNATKYFESKKKHGQKEVKTKEAAEQALKQAQKQAIKEIEKAKNKVQKVQNARKRYWFEKFYWFLSSDGYLVISGRDVQQNELVVKKYLNKDDLYMHADIHGSASTVVKNLTGGQIPESTLMQAATFTICRSKAWDSKIVISAWWVYASQVSKAPPTGLFVPAGSFMIYGKKNFIYPPKLELGGTVLYQLDQESIKNHEAERQKKRAEEELVSLEQSETDPVEKNMFDSDEQQESDGEEQEQPSEIVQEESQVKTIIKEGQEYTIVEVNPNARRIQENNDRKDKGLTKVEQPLTQKQKQQLHQQKQQLAKQQPQQQQVAAKVVETKQQQKQESEEEDNKQGKPVRGKKNKQKKLDKYKDQSDEERELRMRLTGATYSKNQKRPDKKKKQKDESEAPEQQQQPKQQVLTKEQHHKYVAPSITKKLLKEQGIQEEQQQEKVDVVQQPQVEPENKVQVEQIIEQTNQPTQIEQTEVDEKQQEPQIKQVKDKDDSDADDKSQNDNQEEKADEDVIEYNEMQKLVSYVYPDDNYLSLIPMVAPYQVVGNNKFKIKIVPGTLKKGKAGREAITYYSQHLDITPQERNLLKMITDEEMVLTMPSGSKLTGARMLQMKQKEKQQKKQQIKAK